MHSRNEPKLLSDGRDLFHSFLQAQLELSVAQGIVNSCHGGPKLATLQQPGGREGRFFSGVGMLPPKQTNGSWGMGGNGSYSTQVDAPLSEFTWFNEYRLTRMYGYHCSHQKSIVLRGIYKKKQKTHHSGAIKYQLLYKRMISAFNPSSRTVQRC